MDTADYETYGTQTESNGDWFKGTAELAARRTGMAFQRTRLSADRSLMAVIRTSLSLITFGFAIFEFFRSVVRPEVAAAASTTVRHFGIALVLLGVAMLSLGIVYHLLFMRSLRKERISMIEHLEIHGEAPYPVSMVLITAALLWALGLITVASMLLRIGW